MNNSIFGKTTGNVRKYRNNKLTTDKRRNQLTLEPNYHTAKWFSIDLIAIEMKKIKTKMNKPVCMNFGIIILKQNIKTMQNYAIWILTALFIIKLKIFVKIEDHVKKKI